MLKHRFISLAAPTLLLCASFGAAQDGRDSRSNLNRGINQGGHGGQYHHRDQDNYGDRGNGGYRGDGYRDNRRGGIGPGKGALIGGAGGAVLGGVLGGGLKGSLIGGAAGAGIGAIAGKAHQNHRDNNYYGR